MATCRTCDVALKPCINTRLMKPMGTVADNTHHLVYFNRILTDSTIVILYLKGTTKYRMAVDLFRSGSYNDRLIQKRLETSYQSA